MKTRTPANTVCPSCGGRDYKNVPTAVNGSLAMDRICNQCGARYVPPTPFWVIPVVLALALAFPGYILLTAKNIGDVRGAMWFAFAFGILIIPLLIRVIRERRQPS